MSLFLLLLWKLSFHLVLDRLLGILLVSVFAIHGTVAEAFEVTIAVGQPDHLFDVGVLSFDPAIGKADLSPFFFV